MNVELKINFINNCYKFNIFMTLLLIIVLIIFIVIRVDFKILISLLISFIITFFNILFFKKETNFSKMTNKYQQRSKR